MMGSNAMVKRCTAVDGQNMHMFQEVYTPPALPTRFV